MLSAQAVLAQYSSQKVKTVRVCGSPAAAAELGGDLSTPPEAYAL